MKLFLRPKNVYGFLIATFFINILLSCGGKTQDTPSVQQSSTDQIIVVQTSPVSGGGGGSPLSSVSVSPVTLPQPLFQSTAATYTDPNSRQSFVYVIGGAYYDPLLATDPINVNTVYRSLINSAGLLTPWVVDNSNNLPNIRGHSTVIYNNNIYVIGGISTGGFQKAIYRATITMDKSIPPVPLLSQWTWVGDLPVEETGQASVVSGDALFVIGGLESGLPDFTTCSPNCVGSQTTVFSDKIYGYNLISATFSTTSVTRYTMPKKLFTPAAVALPTNQIAVFGGWDGKRNSDTAFIFDVLGTSVTCSLSPCNGYPLPFGGVSKAVSLYLQDNNQIYLIGGVSGSLNTAETIVQNIYSSPASTGLLSWSASSLLPKPVLCFSATSSGNVIFIFGGILTAGISDCATNL
ncbi:MAG: hypothetical protein HY200_05680 [Nitrospirae bacterium]|nr:hypothetical protein [Nitrospirota bacterium]